MALVVGNGNYSNAGRLLNPASDAEAVSDALKRLGFEVFLSKDVDQTHFAGALGEFLNALDGAEAGLFYFAGHGIQINGQNFLLSTNATGESELLIPSEGMELASIITRMEQRAPIALVFVDACRNNPLAERLVRENPASARALGLTRGLARVDQLGRNTLVVYATAPNQTASDGSGAHSPFTNALLAHIATPDLEVSAMLKRVARDVLEETASEQQPEVVASMTSEFYFAVAAATAEAEVVPTVSNVDQRRIAAETAFEFAKKLHTVEAYRFFLEAYPDTPQAESANIAIAALEAQAPARPAIEINSAFPKVNAPGGTLEEEAGLNLSAEDRKGLQITLSTLGYDTHGIDGTFGGGTRDAIKGFQLALNHEPTGFLSRAEFDYLAASQERVKSMLGERAYRITKADLPEGADPRLVSAVEALAPNPMKFGFLDGGVYIAVAKMTKWDEARQLAKKAGGDLAVISSKREDNFIFKLIENDLAFWWVSEDPNTGSRLHFFANGPIFGLYQEGSARSSAQGWTWVDQSPKSYTNWYPGQPNEVQLRIGIGAAGYGGPVNDISSTEARWQDIPVFTANAPGFVVEIAPQ